MSLLSKQLHIEAIIELQSKSIDEIAEMLVSNELSFKSYRNRVIRKDFYKLLGENKLATRDIYIDLEERYDLKERCLYGIINGK